MTTTLTNDELTEMKYKAEQYEKYLARKRTEQHHLYQHKYKYTEDMDEYERSIIKQNIEHRNKIARANYRKNNNTAQRQKDRANQRYFNSLSPEKQAIYLKRKARREKLKANKKITITKSG